MLLLLNLPYVKSGVDHARVERWLVEEGDEVHAGEDICEMVATSELRLKRVSAPRLQIARRRRSAPPERGPGRYVVRVTASEAAVMRRHLAHPGDELLVGGPLALLSTDPADEIDAAPMPMRAAASGHVVERLQ